MPQVQQASTLLNLLFPLLIFFIFYFLIIKPQKSKEKEHLKMLNGLNKNDEVVTNSGIHGTIVNVKDKTVTLRIDDNVKMEVEKNCVAYVRNRATS